ncbi:hypothetical protein SDC9_37629 [bioreactor metagenome]|uniref:Uncharacterized protein n=1 Tax=bioreactor metagenome TaxID=1076179 RepID=A0A644VJI5_9ZZZZ
MTLTQKVSDDFLKEMWRLARACLGRDGRDQLAQEQILKRRRAHPGPRRQHQRRAQGEARAKDAQVARRDMGLRVMGGQVADVAPGQQEHRLRLHVRGAGRHHRPRERAKLALVRIGPADEGPARDLGGLGDLGRAREQRMAAAAIEQVALLVQRAQPQPLGEPCLGQDRKVKRAAGQPRHQRLGIGHGDVEPRLGGPRADPADHLRQRQSAVGHGVVDHPDPQRAGDPVAQPADLALEGVEREEQRVRAGMDQRAALGQGKAAASAPAQREAEPLLKRLDVKADRRLRQAKRDLRAGEALVLDHRAEHGKGAQIGVGNLHSHQPF